MRRVLSSCVLAAVVACSGNPPPGPAVPERPVVRLLEVSPPIGARITRGTPIFVRAAYRVPAAAGEYHASLMFVTEGGATVSAGTDSYSGDLQERDGIIELRGRASDVRHELAEPLTAIVMIIGPTVAAPAADTVTGTPDEVRERLGMVAPDSAIQAADSASAQLRLRVVRRGAGRAAARSRAIFYNGPGPTSALRGPPLPFDEAIEEYRSYRGHKAFALARNDAGRRIWGFSFGYANADSAVARALEECENRVARAELIAACRIHAVNDSVPSS